jgi:hypothetical protein
LQNFFFIFFFVGFGLVLYYKKAHLEDINVSVLALITFVHVFMFAMLAIATTNISSGHVKRNCVFESRNGKAYHHHHACVYYIVLMLHVGVGAWVI